MRIFIFCLGMAVAVSGLAAHTTHAATGNENRAQRIAQSLKQSGKLRDYRVGVKYEDGVAWLSGTVTSHHQKQIAEQVARRGPGVKHVVNRLEVEDFGSNRGAASRGAASDQNFQAASAGRNNSQRGQMKVRRQRRPAARSPRNNMPVPYARTGRGIQQAGYSRQAQFTPGGPMAGGMGPAPMRGGAPAAVGQSVSYDNPQMPDYAWPSYAASPNYAALTYPKQYSPSAWPYIGPFYPYPQVPLGWRKVTLEWDDGWWFLDFKDCKHCK